MRHPVVTQEFGWGRSRCRNRWAWGGAVQQRWTRHHVRTLRFL